MKKKPLYVGSVLFALAMLLVAGFEAQGVDRPTEPGSERSDVIIIDTLRSKGDLEQGVVAYFHDAHTEAMEKAGKDCSACHLKDPERGNAFSWKYMRLSDDLSADKLKEVYHTNCISCHAELADKGQKSGPLTVNCGGCHAKGSVTAPKVFEPGMDKSLHYRHIKAEDKPVEETCKSCHHQYDQEKKELVYVKGQEGSCRYCHKATETSTPEVKNIQSLQTAVHESCVSCHLKNITKKEHGPVKCEGCHNKEKYAQYKKATDVPRLLRGQKDVYLIQPDETDPVYKRADGSKPALIGPVAFNHKAHEEYEDTCRVCHHANIESCGSCHTVAGDKKGNFVQLSQAMHDPTSMASCVGCHEQRVLSQPDCAGCHYTIDAYDVFDQNSCSRCHVQQVPEVAAESCMEQDVDPVVQAENKKLCNEAKAQALLDARVSSNGLYTKDDIPEKVVIKVLEDQYGPSELPHLKIVNSMMEKIKDSKLAGFSHADRLSICGACHHQSPPSKNPPSCISCHGKPFDPAFPNRPGIKAAYHQQCMGCHTQLNLEKPKATDCQGCHKLKNTTQG